MKFHCGNCQAKYQIADEKIAGRSVRMKCRTCGHSIEIGTPPVETSATLVFSANLLRAGANSPSGAGPSGQAERPGGGRAQRAKPIPVTGTVVAGPMAMGAVARGGPAGGTEVHGGLASAFQQAVAAEAKAVSERAAPSGGEWFVGVNGTTAGPLDLNGLRAQVLSGAAQGGSLVWREGFREWLPLDRVPELREIASLARSEPSPLSSRAGALVGRLGFGPRAARLPASAAQVAPPPPAPAPSEGVVPSGGVHETMVLGPGAAMPSALAEMLGRPPIAKQPAITRNPAVPSSPTPLSSPRQTGPAPMSLPRLTGPAPMAAPRQTGPAPMGAPAFGPGMPSGGPGMGAPARGGPLGGAGVMGGTAVVSIPQLQQQGVSFPQQYGAPVAAAPPGFGVPPGFGAAAMPGFAPVNMPARSRGGIPFVGWVTVALALCTGVVVGAKLLSSEKIVEVSRGGEITTTSSPVASTESKGGVASKTTENSGSTAPAKPEASAAVASAPSPTKAEKTGAGGAAPTPPADTTASPTRVAVTAPTSKKNPRERERESKPSKPAAPDKNVETTIVSDNKGPPAPPAPPPPPPPPAQNEQLTNEQVQGVVDVGRTALRRVCWEPALAAAGGGAASARVTVSLTIGPDGKVRQAIASGGETYPSLGSCVSGRVRAWIFPSASGVTQTSVPLKFVSN